MNIAKTKAGLRLLLFCWLAMILVSLLFWSEPLVMAFAWAIAPLVLWLMSLQGGGVMVSYSQSSSPVSFFLTGYSALLLAIPVVLIAIKLYIRFWAARWVSATMSKKG